MQQKEIEQWKVADALFDRLLELPEPGRAEALAQLSLDADVHARVKRLLDADQGTRTLSGAADVAAAIPVSVGETRDVLAGRRIGRWTIESEIGRGGMSVVYRAHATEAPDRIAAIKLLTLGALAGPGAERFRREQAILARLNHPHIATLIDAGIAEDGTPWIAMVLVDGQRIDLWSEQHDLDIGARVRLFLDVCAAVAHAHRSLVVHRDLKPSNVLVDGEGHVRLLDFGIARLLDDTARETTATHWRALSPMYAAPEQFTGTAQSTLVDIFGLGAVLYVLLTGMPPRTQGAQNPILAPSKAAPGACSASADLDAIVMKALSEDPADRYATANAFSDDLQHWLTGQPIIARRPPLHERVARHLRRHWLTTALSVAVLASLMGGSMAALQQARQANAQTERAVAARAEALDSLSRANALRDYLLGIFETQAPGKPRNELPTTTELLDEGEHLALGSTFDNAGVRADMLDAITQIRLARSDTNRASALIERSLALANKMETGAAAVRARALMRRSTVKRIGREFELALTDLREASTLLAGGAGQTLAIDVKLAVADMHLAQRQFELALETLLPLSDPIDTRVALSPNQRSSLYGSMAIALSGLGRVRESIPYRERALEEIRQRYGMRHFRVAVALANVAVGNRQIGAFDAADHQAREALAIYDEVLDGPSEYRGSARVGLGLLEAARGRFDEAITELDLGNTEIAAVRGIARVEDYDFFHWNRGIVLAQAGRRDEAIVALTRAEASLAQRPAAYAMPDATAAAWLAILNCGQGNFVQGETWRDRMHAIGFETKGMAASDSAVHFEAEARCALAAGDAALAQRELTPALASDATLELGFAADTARRQCLAAQISRAMGDNDAAKKHTQLGLAQLRKAGLSAHPLQAELAAAVQSPDGDGGAPRK